MWSSVIKQFLVLIERFAPSIAAFFAGKKIAKQDIEKKQRSKNDKIVEEILDDISDNDTGSVRERYTRHDG